MKVHRTINNKRRCTEQLITNEGAQNNLHMLHEMSFKESDSAVMEQIC